MSYRWPPEEEPKDAQWPQSPRSDDPRYGYGDPGPYSTGGSGGSSGSGGRSGGWPEQQGGSWSQWGEPPGQGYYQPGRPYPQTPQYPAAPYGNPDPYGGYGQYGPPGPYEYPPSSGRRSRNLLLPVLLVLVALIVVSGAAYALITYGPRIGTHPTTTSGASAAPAGFHTYSNTTIGVRFVVPDGWTTDDNIAVAGGHEMQATSPDGNAALGVGSIAGTGNLDGGLNGALAGMAGSGGKVSNKKGPTNVTIAGTTWMQESGDITRDGARLHAVVLDVEHSGHVYFLIFVATTSTFTDINAHYFQVTIKSFQFLS